MYVAITWFSSSEAQRRAFLQMVSNTRARVHDVTTENQRYTTEARVSRNSTIRVTIEHSWHPCLSPCETSPADFSMKDRQVAN
jgi:hypothetical protein